MKKIVFCFVVIPLATALPSLGGSKIEELQGLLKYYERTEQRHSDRLTDLSEDITRLKGELEQAEASSAPYTEAIEAKRQIEVALPKIKPILLELENDLGRLDAILDGYKEAFVRKDVAPGTPLGNIVTASGQSYTNAYVQSVGLDTVQIRHVNGLTNLLIDDLPESMRSEFSREPRPSNMEIDFVAILGKKPRFLMTPEEYRKFSEWKQAIEQGKVDASNQLRLQQSAEKRQEDEARRLAEMQSKEARRLAEVQSEEARRLAEMQSEEARRQIERELQILEAQRDELYDQMSRINSAIGSIRTGSANIRRSAVDIEKERQKYEAAANQVKLRIREIDRQMSLLRSQR
jgi:chromosome segregation ATPase